MFLIILVSCTKETINITDKVNSNEIHSNVTRTVISTDCSGAKLQWEDNFTGSSIDLNKWGTLPWFKHRYRFAETNPLGDDYGKEGGGIWRFDQPESTPNLTAWDEALCVTYSNPNGVIVSNGTAKIKCNHDVFVSEVNRNADFSSGFLVSHEAFRYGYFEIRAKIPAGSSLGASFWISGTEEIDVFEIPGWQTTTYPMNVHVHSIDGDNNSPMVGGQEIVYNMSPTDLSYSFHTYAVNWQPNLLEWYVDNKLVRQIADPSRIPNVDCSIILSVNMPDARADVAMITGTKNNNIAFSDFEIDYVRMYDKRPTRALFTTLNNQATISTLSDFTDWSCNWDIIVPGNFDGDNYTDLLLYSKTEGALFVSTDGNGNIVTLQHYPGWRSTWDILVPGNYGGSSLTDILLYDKTAGEIEVFTLDGSYYLNQTGMSTNFTNIVSGNFITSNIICYDKTAGEIKFYKTNSGGNINLIATQTGFGTGWTSMTEGNFNGDSNSDVLLYNKVNGTASFYKPLGSPTLNLSNMRNHSGWRTSWNNIIAGDFNGTGNSDLLLYDKGAGEAYFFTVSTTDQGLGNINSYSDWSNSWEMIVPGEFGSDSVDDLLYYNH